jgi:hypothetical protein
MGQLPLNVSRALYTDKTASALGHARPLSGYRAPNGKERIAGDHEAEDSWRWRRTEFGSAGNLEVDEHGHHTGIEMIQEVAVECPPAGIVGVKSDSHTCVRGNEYRIAHRTRESYRASHPGIVDCGSRRPGRCAREDATEPAPSGERPSNGHSNGARSQKAHKSRTVSSRSCSRTVSMGL